MMQVDDIKRLTMTNRWPRLSDDSSVCWCHCSKYCDSALSVIFSLAQLCSRPKERMRNSLVLLHIIMSLKFIVRNNGKNVFVYLTKMKRKQKENVADFAFSDRSPRCHIPDACGDRLQVKPCRRPPWWRWWWWRWWWGSCCLWQLFWWWSSGISRKS